MVTSITNVTQLQAMENNLAADYELANDIDASVTPTWDSGRGFDPVGTFTGTFDGKGYVIDSLYINRPGEFRNALFGYADGATIQNVGLTNISITSDNNQLGGLVGLLQDSAVTKCYATGTITGDTGSNFDGGLVGLTSGTSSITKCYSRVNITVSNGNDIGGLLGRGFGTLTITDCYATGDVVGSDDCGGLIGENYGTIDNCYSIGIITGTTDVGGLCGKNNGTITDSFWDTQTSGQATSDGGTGRTTAQMKTESTFTDAGWDFSTPVWYITPLINNGYPNLDSGPTTYPSDPIMRETALIHIYKPLSPPSGVYNLITQIGGLSTAMRPLGKVDQIDDDVGEGPPEDPVTGTVGTGGVVGALPPPATKPKPRTKGEIWGEAAGVLPRQRVLEVKFDKDGLPISPIRPRPFHRRTG